jgi:recombinational DNA repair protein (RecF pathway)
LTGKIHPCRDNRGFAGVRQARRMERKATSIFALGSILLFLFFARRSFSGLEKYF